MKSTYINPAGFKTKQMKVINELKEWLLLVAYILTLIFVTKLGGLILEDYKQFIDKHRIEIDEDNIKAQTFIAELELRQLQVKKMRAEYESLK